jgi:hypothetical protein
VDPSRGDAGPPPAAAAEVLGHDLSARLERWAAEVRVDHAARQRTQERWLRRQAAEEASLAGVLADLAERGEPVVVRTRAGRQHRGVVRAVGADFLALAAGDAAAGAAAGAGAGASRAADVLVALAAVASLRTGPGPAPATGDRPAAAGGGLRLADVLAGLAAERDRVVIASLDGRDAVAGEIRAVGADVAVVRLEGGGGTAYVPLGAVAEVTVGP